jgi:hypothetical protein
MSHQPITTARPVITDLKTMSGRALAFLADIEQGRIPISEQSPIAEIDVLTLAAIYLKNGWISARRLARAMDTDFDTLNSSFSEHDIQYQIGL